MPRYVPIQDMETQADLSDTDYVPVSDGETSFAVQASKFKAYSTDRAEAAADAAEAAQAAAETAAATFVTDKTLSVSDKAADAAVTGNKIGELKSNLTNTTICKNLIGMEAGVYYPVYIPDGTALYVYTSDGSNFQYDDNLRLNAYDASKTQVATYGLSASQSERLFRTTGDGEIAYLRWNYASTVPIMVEKSLTKSGYVPYFAPVK